mmetsp:Transcript_28746/g.93909  ORF Transcript_28746/g.93909 Transcript_28746/m.93909 type:complete len:291 (-) Transcript_28746:617-1489(-)
MVELHRGEGRVLLRVARVDAELEDGEHDAQDKGALQGAHRRDLADGQLAEDGEGELLEQLVLKNVHARLVRERVRRWARRHCREQRGVRLRRQEAVGVRHRRSHRLPRLWQRRRGWRGGNLARRHGLLLAHRRGLLGEGCLDLLNGCVHVAVDVANEVKRGVRRKVPALVEAAAHVAVPLLDLLRSPDWEARAERVLPVQLLQELTIDTVLNRVHHLRFGEDCSPLLLDARIEKQRVERNIVESLQHLWQHPVASCVLRRGVHMEDGVVEVRVGVRPRSRAEQPLTLLGA